MLPLPVGGQRQQRQGVFGADVVNQKVQIRLWNGVHQGGRLTRRQNPVQRLFRRQSQDLVALALQRFQTFADLFFGKRVGHVGSGRP